MNRTSWISAASLSALAIAVVAFAWRKGHSKAVVEPASTAATGGLQSPPGLPEWQLEDGTVLTYDLVDRGSMGTQMVGLEGVLKIEVLAARPDFYLAWLSYAATATGGTSLSGGLAELVPLLQRGRLATLGRRGFVLALAGDQEAAALGLTLAALRPVEEVFWRQIGERLRADWGEQPLNLPFQRRESLGALTVEVAYDLKGRCLADGSDAAVMQRTWRPVPGFGPRSSGVASAQFLKGCQGLRLLNSVGDELAGSDATQMTAHTELSLAWRSQQQLGLAAVRSHVEQLLGQQVPVVNPNPANGIDAAVVGTLDEAQLLALLRQQDGRDEVGQDLYLQLKSWLALHPESIAALRRAVQDLPSDDQRQRALIKALSAVGSAEAQDALIDMIKGATAVPDLQHRLITSLGLVAHPTDATVQAILDLAEHGSSPTTTQRARMASGIVGSRLRTSPGPGDQQRATALESRLVAWLQGASSEHEIYDSLAALGNLGPINPAPVRALLDRTTSPELRSQAFFALRFSPDDGISDYLAEAYQHEKGDGAPQVRGDIVRSLAFRQPDAAWFHAVAELSKAPLTAGEAQVMGQALARAATVDPVRSRALLTQLAQGISDDATKRALLELRDPAS